MCLIAAWASWLRGGRFVYDDESDEVGPFGAPQDPDAEPGRAPETEQWVPA
jgi:hypothetical protein